MPRMDKLSEYRTTWATNETGGTVTYANTEIVRWEGKPHHTPLNVTLRTGRWDTVTTRRKMNQAARQFGLGYGVYRKAGESFVRIVATGADLPLEDGMTFEAWGQL
jgi:hypothetical protein